MISSGGINNFEVVEEYVYKYKRFFKGKLKSKAMEYKGVGVEESMENNEVTEGSM